MGLMSKFSRFGAVGVVVVWAAVTVAVTVAILDAGPSVRAGEPGIDTTFDVVSDIESVAATSTSSTPTTRPPTSTQTPITTQTTSSTTTTTTQTTPSTTTTRATPTTTATTGSVTTAPVSPPPTTSASITTTTAAPPGTTTTTTTPTTTTAATPTTTTTAPPTTTTTTTPTTTQAPAGPIAVDDFATVGGNTTHHLVIENDIETGHPIVVATLSIVVPPDHAHDYSARWGRIRYHPVSGYEGPDQLTYEICDASGGCDTATLDLTVELQ